MTSTPEGLSLDYECECPYSSILFMILLSPPLLHSRRFDPLYLLRQAALNKENARAPVEILVDSRCF